MEKDSLRMDAPGTFAAAKNERTESVKTDRPQVYAIPVACDLHWLDID